ncbi:MAG TPA: GNAT family N-acetyltransferase [Verrucomicrobiae bacterium]|jgi:GNAT superfamily N-acetyltransferase|nr:GNAT family N-acetyltransferase [Verrucomicrobiae bacterium]
MTWRMAHRRDCTLLAELNRQLITDEGHRNPMTIPELEARMSNWIDEGFDAVLFERDVEVAAYALYRADPEEIYLRHFFVVRHLRRQGIGREAMRLLRDCVWPASPRLTVSVLTHNTAGLKFWQAMGYRDYCLTMEILR